MDKIKRIYDTLFTAFGSQGWWPIINNKTLICEYGMGAPRNEAEALEICIGAILTQGTQWYPNIVRAIQQLKLGREFKKQELEVIRQAEIHKGHIREKPRKQTTNHILTQNTSWKNVEKAIKNLKDKNLLDEKALEKISTKELAQIIKPAGYYNQKTKKIKEFIKFDKEFTRENLLKIWGIGKETADSILLYAFNKPYFVIDAYTKRVISRLKLTKNLDYDDLQNLFTKNLPKNVNLYKEYHALLVELGKNYCKKEPICNTCPLNKICKK